MVYMNRYSFRELTVGQTENFSTTVTVEMLDAFRGITGDVNPLHNDERFAKAHGYPNRVIYGMLTASFLSTLAGVYLPGEKSLIQSVEVKFAKPVLTGDRLTIRGTIEELNDTVQQIVLKVEIRNQNEEKVLRGKMKVGVLE